MTFRLHLKRVELSGRHFHCLKADDREFMAPSLGLVHFVWVLFDVLNFPGLASG
jgi:hypothetical protein